METELWDRFLARLETFLSPFEGQLAYGNLRKEVSEWGGGESRSTNIAIIYETPGGSTNQINVVFHHHTQHFSILDPATGSERELNDLEELFQMLRRYVEDIPLRRREVLQNHIRSWKEEGFTRQQALQSLNLFLQPMNLKGGKITEGELREAARFVVRLYAGQA